MSGNGVGDGFGNGAGGGAGGIDKPAGWYYVGDGKLRYRDAKGWTSHYLSTKDPAAQNWPPPPPRTFLQQVLDDQERTSGASPSQSQGRAWRRGFGLRRR